jgi:hypothetical protein
MTAPISAQPVRSIAILVISARSEPVLCPFFRKCDGVLLVDRSGRQTQLYKPDVSDDESVCDLILRLNPDGLICGFVGDAEKEKLNAAGIDVRLGSCSCPIDELYAEFDNLPKA